MSTLPPRGNTQPEAAPLKITVIFNNVAYNTLLRTGWGFACLVETAGHAILFDAGGDGEVLLSNMNHLGVDPGTIDMVVLSHIHADHTGGLGGFSPHKLSPYNLRSRILSCFLLFCNQELRRGRQNGGCADTAI